MSTNEHIYCTGVVCICSKAAAHAAEVLAHPAFFRHRFAERTCPGGISGIDSDKQNTVLLRQHLDPCDDLPIGPRGDSLAKGLSSAGLLAQLHVFQILDTEATKSSPRQSLHLPVDVVFARPGSAESSLALGLATPNPSTDSLDFNAVPVSVGVDEQLVDPNVDAENISHLRLLICYLNPESSPTIPKRAALEQFGPRLFQPVVEPLVTPERDDYGLALDQTRDLEHIVEGAFARLDLADEAAQADSSVDMWAGCRNACSPRRLARRREGLQCHLETVGAVAIREASPRDPIQGGGVQPSRIGPEVVDVALRAAFNLTQERSKPAPLCYGSKSQRNFDRALHLFSFQRLDGSFGLLTPAPLPIETSREASQDGNKVFHEVRDLVFGAVHDFDLERANNLEPGEPKPGEPIFVLDEQHIEVTQLEQTMKTLSLVVHSATKLFNHVNNGPPLGFSEATKTVSLRGQCRLVFRARLATVDSTTRPGAYGLTNLGLEPGYRNEPSSSRRNDGGQCARIGLAFGMGQADSKQFGCFRELYSTVHCYHSTPNETKVKD